MDIKKIETIQKENAEAELKGWLAILQNDVCLAPSLETVEKVKQALFVLSQSSKALRRYGHFIGLDKE